MFLLIQILFCINVLYFVWQIYLNTKYSVKQNIDFYPKVSVIIPAFNEGKCVAETIFSVLKSDYPIDKLDIIVINDGSTDDTDKIICDSIKNTNIRYFNLVKNKGKRNAIFLGVNNAYGDVVITLDSDSIIDKDTIKNLIIQFQDNTVGAVAGNILVRNSEHFISKMLYSAFIFGFKFLRPAQSVLGCVLCTPGALSAYRKDVIKDKLYNWKQAKFLGKRSNIGEDRALTTIVLKSNYKVVYQDNAYCYTNVPINYINLSKMFIRWIRGDIRESFSLFWFISHIFKYKYWVFNFIGLFINLTIQLIWLLSPFLLFYYIYLCISNQLSFGLFLYSSVIFGIFWSILPAYICYKTKNIKMALYSILFNLFNIFTLFWVIPYSWFTVYKSKWLTR